MKLAKHLTALERRSQLVGPQDDDELHRLIRDRYGLDIPREPVCEGHSAPFAALADFYFERVLAAIWMANRGGSKTAGAALLHLLNSKFKARCESASVGAIETQAFRAYEQLKRLIKVDARVDNPEDHPEIASSIMRETTWKNGSKVEVLAGTQSAVNGPHPQKVHFDEVELADPIVFSESRSMSQSRDGIRAQDLITSTRKRAHGPMQRLIEECQDAERLGKEPPYQLYTWCAFECAENQPNCRGAQANKDKPEGELCKCDQVVKGKWDDGTPRTFEDVCKGKLARSKGWIPIHDLHKTFRLVGQDVWEAQHECSKPSAAGLVLPQLNRERHCIRWWNPDPGLGAIFMAVDFGGTNPHAVEWFQVLRFDVDAWGYHQQRNEEPTTRLRQGTRVVFDEIYRAEIGNNQLADMIVRREDSWRSVFPSFRVHRRFADVQAKAARLDWARGEPPLHTVSYAPKDIKEQVKWIKELVEDDMMVIDITRSPMLIEEMEAWHYPDKKGAKQDDPEIPVDDFCHAIAAMRYGIANVRALERSSKRSGLPGIGDKRDPLAPRSLTGTGPARYLPREREQGHDALGRLVGIGE